MSFYVTTAISYVNGPPHMGHAYEAIATDVLARHMRQRGEDVFFLTGTDEHGEPVADAAHAEGVQPQELADRNAARFREMAAALDISNDFFIRTTDEEHKVRVQEVLQRVHDNGHTYKGLYEGWYCPRCADFKVENEILDGNRCPIHEIELTREQEENWFFRLSTFQEPLERLFAERPDFVHAPAPLQRGARVPRVGPRGHLALARAPEVGGRRPVGSQPRVLRLVRRAAQLLHRARLRPARGRPDRALLAGELPCDRQGHPQVPHDLLAGDADGGGHRGAAAGLRPRLPARRRRAQDEQVARQRARPASRCSSPSAPTRCASTCCATCHSAATARWAWTPCARDTTRSSPTTTGTSRAGR